MERIRRDSRDKSPTTVGAGELRSAGHRASRAVNATDERNALRVPTSASTWLGSEGTSRIRRSDAAVGTIRRYKKTRADDGGEFVGEASACHCHIKVGKPHFKVGKDDGSRINFGRDMILERMQHAYEVLLTQHRGKAGFDDCREYLEEQGCVEPVADESVEKLKKMIRMWGGEIDDHSFEYYEPEGKKQLVDAHSAAELDEVIEAHQAQIHASYLIYNDFLDEGGFVSDTFASLDEDAMADEAALIYQKENKATKNAAGHAAKAQAKADAKAEKQKKKELNAKNAKSSNQ